MPVDEKEKDISMGLPEILGGLATGAIVAPAVAGMHGILNLKELTEEEKKNLVEMPEKILKENYAKRAEFRTANEVEFKESISKIKVPSPKEFPDEAGFKEAQKKYSESHHAIQQSHEERMARHAKQGTHEARREFAKLERRAEAIPEFRDASMLSRPFIAFDAAGHKTKVAIGVLTLVSALGVAAYINGRRVDENKSSAEMIPG